MRWRRLKEKYGISREQFEEMLDDQGGRCLICGRKEVRFCVDHDHESGVVRGLLCYRCNTGLGGFNDSPVLLQKAINYLMKGA
jgi:hypothetical protein